MCKQRTATAGQHTIAYVLRAVVVYTAQKRIGFNGRYNKQCKEECLSDVHVQSRANEALTAKTAKYRADKFTGEINKGEAVRVQKARQACKQLTRVL